MRAWYMIAQTAGIVACACSHGGGPRAGGTGGAGGVATGGTSPSGGTVGSGGVTISIGGTTSTGGITAMGGAISAGGTTSTGKTTAWNPNAGDFHYKVDQFGYLPNEEKVAVISSAQVGFNAPDSYEPGPTLEVYSWPNDILVYSGPVTPWNGGATDALAGDKGWWFDFSSVTASDSYVIKDPKKQKRSHVFRIDNEVFDPILMHALRTYYYQREGCTKQTPYGDARWADNASHANDKKARSVFAKDDASTERDVYGGWMDAGDQNKYITFLDDSIPHLLYAYTKYPEVFTDTNRIPESGNGIPDILDEIQWEIDWMLKMQDSDGGVFIKAGCTDSNDPSPPSSDTRPRYYGKKCTSSSISFSAIIAQTAYVYRDIPALSGKTADLASAAEKAWTWFSAQPSLDEACDQGEIKSGDADRTAEEQEMQAARAAMWLYALTGKETYHDYFKANHAKLNGMSLSWWGPYNVSNDDVAFFYATLPGADPTVTSAIAASLAGQKSNCADYYTTSDDKALYRAYMAPGSFHTGSNRPRAAIGNILMRMIDFGVSSGDHAAFRKRALQHLHWLHGVNALGKVYLSNMIEHGAEDSVDQFFHSWFAHGTIWDSASGSDYYRGPAPGYLVGGPNITYGTESWYDPVCKTIVPPYGQPGEKSYKDFNEGWPEASYAVTENSIAYQSEYVRLLAAAIHTTM